MSCWSCSSASLSATDLLDPAEPPRAPFPDCGLGLPDGVLSKAADLADPFLPVPGLPDPGLADPGLADPGLADPGLAEPGRDPLTLPLADAGLLPPLASAVGFPNNKKLSGDCRW